MRRGHDGLRCCFHSSGGERVLLVSGSRARHLVRITYIGRIPRHLNELRVEGGEVDAISIHRLRRLLEVETLLDSVEAREASTRRAPTRFEKRRTTPAGVSR